MTPFFDSLETRSPAEREAALMAALPRQISHAQAHSPAFAAILQGVDGAAINSRAALARLPVTRKHELLERQQAARQAGSEGDVFGGFSALRFGALAPGFPSFDFAALTLRPLPLVSSDHARRPLRFVVPGRAIFTLLAW